ncbi:hypothetical protein HQ535_01990 [bacterium]|nr:hypothetical protein [bacterium]
MPVLAIWTPEDGLLGALAPLGAALGAPGPALLIDLDPGGPSYPGDASLADIVAEGPRRPDLAPERTGVAVIRNGGVPASDAGTVIAALVDGWPNVVLRLPPRPAPSGVPVPVVPVRLLIPCDWFPPTEGPGVFQATPATVPGRIRGIRLPVPSRSTVAALLGGRAPAPRDRWVAAWRRVWEVSWPG